ncbi:MAG: hypothetical protein IJY15_11610, partial [Thermoguttaceae bacterium]|nr:hypothetical protein [Thermoguttaceae bacterium]
MTPRSPFSLFVRSRRSRSLLLGTGVLTATLVSPLFAVDAPSTQTPAVAAPPTANAAAPSEPIRLVLTRLDVVHEGVVR